MRSAGGLSVVVVLVVLQTVRISVGAPIDTTIETTTGPPIETTLSTCSDLSYCDTLSCHLDYSDIDTATGCPNCVCEERLLPACQYNPCGTEEECVQNDSFWDFTCVPYETTLEPTTCPPIACDDTINCFVENGQDGCPAQCICGDPICMMVSCDTDEECVPSQENYYDYTCVSIYGTSTAPPTCPPISCDDPNCWTENGEDGCPERCICGDTICMIVSCGPDATCVPNKENNWEYTCESTYDP